MATQPHSTPAERARHRRGMRMRKSAAELEDAFAKEVSLERRRRQSLLRTTAQRTLQRHTQRKHRHGSMRFAALAFTLLATAVIVTVVMFRTLYLLLG